MEITEVRIFPRESDDHKLKAYATITIDDAFVIRNVKVIEGNKGLFVAMPSRKLKGSCPKCRHKNVVRSKFCNQCGKSLPSGGNKPVVVEQDGSGKQSDHRDIAHPITPECRDYIQTRVLGAYEAFMKDGSNRGERIGETAQAKPVGAGAVREASTPQRPQAPPRPQAPQRPQAPPRTQAEPRPQAPPRTQAPPRPQAPPRTQPEQPTYEGDLEL